MKHIAYIETDFKEKFGIPRQSSRTEAEGRIVFLPEYRVREALRGLEGFSHLWIIFDFSESHTEKWSPTVRPPRLGGNVRMGVFATRSPFRPNPIGISSVKIEGIEHSETLGDTILVSGVDLLDGTPIFDIKPYIASSDSHPEAVGGFSDGAAGHKLNVCDGDALLGRIPEKKRETLMKALADDPRPSYQNDAERIYSMRFSDYDVAFRVDGENLYVLSVKDI
ncbi:MAG: tRNA (N6-threonylcarbamoyladenosine(37)-N6)-methyltransferase TrmO [Firmicutes bacterium]|nr:tRNA (N6-threonylcarbamoyladenosine(37)-N6)-methyltransferase TrmO [Candidatus Colimorpha enterica]